MTRDLLSILTGQGGPLPLSLDTREVDAQRLERDLFDALEREMPDLWRACYPRVYTEPKCGLYYSSKKAARQLAHIGFKMRTGTVGPSEIYEFHLASQLTRFKVPMYWLSAPIAEAIKMTTPPGRFDWYEMPMAFEAAVFMMPKGSLVHSTDGEVPFICYARLKSNQQHFAPLVPGKPYGSVNGGMVIAAAVESGYFIHWNIPLDKFGPVVTLPELQELMQQFRTNEHRTAVPLRDGGMKPADHDLGLNVAHYIFSTLMLMTARPDLVTHGYLTNRAPAKKGRAEKEFWSPHIIGEHYKVHRQPGPSQGGTHASPRFHWVHGFWREQPHGPERKLRRTQWIEPYTRGLDQDGHP